MTKPWICRSVTPVGLTDPDRPFHFFVTVSDDVLTHVEQFLCLAYLVHELSIIFF